MKPETETGKNYEPSAPPRPKPIDSKLDTIGVVGSTSGEVIQPNSELNIVPIRTYDTRGHLFIPHGI